MKPRSLAVALAAQALVACDTDTLDLSMRGSPDFGVSGDAAAGGVGGGIAHGGAGGQASPGGGVPPADAFATEILPLLERGCGQPFCHGRPPVADAHFTFEVPVSSLSPASIAANLAEVRGQLDFAVPEQSPLLLWPSSQSAGQPAHPTPQPVYSPANPDYTALLAWIRTQAPEGPPTGGTGGSNGFGGSGGMGGTGGVAPGGEGIPCSALPSPDRTPYDYATWQMTVQPLLLTQCGTGCHGIAGAAGGLWLQPLAEPCATQWNFLAVQWFIDARSPRTSPLLTKPLDPLHAGRAVFANAADPGYITLSRWIEESLSR